MNQDNLSQVLTNYILYVDSSSLMQGNLEFFKISLYNVLKSTKRQIKVVDFVVKDLKKKQFSDSEKLAVKALSILDFYRKRGLVEDVVTSGIEQGKILDVIYNNRHVDKGNVCVITENRELANEIVSNLSSKGHGVEFDHKIAAVRLISGPALWDIRTAKPKVEPIRRERTQSAPRERSKGVSFDSVKSPSIKPTSFDARETHIEEAAFVDRKQIEPIKEIPKYKESIYKETNYKDPDYKDPDYKDPTYAVPESKEEPTKRYARESSGRDEYQSPSYGGDYDRKPKDVRYDPKPYVRKSDESYRKSEPVQGTSYGKTPSRQEAPRQEAPRQEAPRYEEVRREAPRNEEPRHEEARREEYREPAREPQREPQRRGRVKHSKLVVSFVVDNSSSLSGPRAQKLKEALEIFNQQVQNSDVASDLDYAVYGFDGFSPRVIKSYDGPLEINRFDGGGIQVLGKSIELAMDELVDRQKQYANHSVETHKPWLIILSDGDAYGNLQAVADKLKKVVKGRKITFFPFSLSSYELEDALAPLAKLKMFLKIKDDRFEDLFNFLFNTLSERVHTPKSESMTLDKQAIQRFIAR